MNSKILITQAYDRKPAIQVQEGDSDDVRDLLTRLLREDLTGSTTFQKRSFYQSDETKQVQYQLVPVTDELDYFKERLYTLIGVPDRQVGTRMEVTPDMQLIDDFFKEIEKYIK